MTLIEDRVRKPAKLILLYCFKDNRFRKTEHDLGFDYRETVNITVSLYKKTRIGFSHAESFVSVTNSSSELPTERT